MGVERRADSFVLENLLEAEADARFHGGNGSVEDRPLSRIQRLKIDAAGKIADPEARLRSDLLAQTLAASEGVPFQIPGGAGQDRQRARGLHLLELGRCPL